MADEITPGEAFRMGKAAMERIEAHIDDCANQRREINKTLREIGEAQTKLLTAIETRNEVRAELRQAVQVSYWKVGIVTAIVVGGIAAIQWFALVVKTGALW